MKIRIGKKKSHQATKAFQTFYSQLFVCTISPDTLLNIPNKYILYTNMHIFRINISMKSHWPRFLLFCSSLSWILPTVQWITFLLSVHNLWSNHIFIHTLAPSHSNGMYRIEMSLNAQHLFNVQKKNAIFVFGSVVR